MKIEIDLSKCCGFTEVIELKSQADYDALACSDAGYEREVNAKPGERRTCGRIERYRNAPDRFPCIMIEGLVIYRSDGPDMIPVTYLYDYRVIPTEADMIRGYRQQQPVEHNDA